MYAYIGCRTTKERNARGKGIRVYEINNGAWELKQIAKGQVNPSYLCLNEKQDRLYAIHGDFSEVSVYKVAEDGTLTYQNTTETHGTNPVHLTMDRTGKWLFVANLQTGGVSVIPVEEDGSLGKIKELKFISGNGGPGYISHPHQVCQDRSGKWLLVPSQGRLQGVGKITVFRIDSEHGNLKETSMVKGRSGSEPRHCVLHPNNRFCYCLNEKDSTVACYYFDEDSVTVFRLDQENGHMTYIQNIKTKGEQPRFITINPDGTMLLAANELTDTICCMDIDPETGLLAYSGTEIAAESPVCVVFKTK